MNIRRLLSYLGDGLARLVLALALIAASLAAADAHIPIPLTPKSLLTAAPDAGPSALLRFTHPEQNLETRTGQHSKIFPASDGALRPEDAAFCLPHPDAAGSAPAWLSMHDGRVRLTRVRGPPRN